MRLPIYSAGMLPCCLKTIHVKHRAGREGFPEFDTWKKQRSAA